MEESGLKLAQNSNQSNALFHWGEGNKFALEFFKTVFLFNSTLTISLVAFISSTKYNSTKVYRAIAMFMFAAFVSIIVFGLGYAINLRQGNSYQQVDPTKASILWNSANRLQLWIYILIGAVFVLMLVGFCLLIGGAREYASVAPSSVKSNTQ